MSHARELRFVLVVEDYDIAAHVFRAVCNLKVLNRTQRFTTPDGLQLTLFEAGSGDG